MCVRPGIVGGPSTERNATASGGHEMSSQLTLKYVGLGPGHEREMWQEFNSGRWLQNPVRAASCGADLQKYCGGNAQVAVWFRCLDPGGANPLNSWVVRASTETE